MKYFIPSFILLAFISSCFVPKESETDILENGRYKNISAGRKPVFAQFEDSVIRLYTLSKKGTLFFTDKNNEQISLYPEIQSSSALASLRLLKTTFDLDIIIIPFKYRFAVAGLPDQFNTNFSGAFYTGIRNDVYNLKYKEYILAEPQRKISHYGFGFGVFGGVGSTAMNPWVTRNSIVIEYDGFVFVTGGGGLIAMNNLSFGVGVGIDHLMDKNRKQWIYRGQPWIGLTIGLNLN